MAGSPVAPFQLLSGDGGRWIHRAVESMSSMNYALTRPLLRGVLPRRDRCHGKTLALFFWLGLSFVVLQNLLPGGNWMNHHRLVAHDAPNVRMAITFQILPTASTRLQAASTVSNLFQSRRTSFSVIPHQLETLARHVEKMRLKAASEAGQIAQEPWKIDFADPSVFGDWREVDDRIMGGSSRSRMVYADGCTNFEGELVVEGGGFASVRYGQELRLASDVSKFLIEAKSDGHVGYKLQLMTVAAPPGVSYQCSLDFAGKNQFEQLRLPLSRFRASFRGQPYPAAPPLLAVDIRSCGLMLSRYEVGGSGVKASVLTGSFKLQLRSLAVRADTLDDPLQRPVDGLPSRVISFDLDDTIWPIKPVVANANAAVARVFPALNADAVQAKMKDIRVSTAHNGVRLSYTELRTAAYHELLLQSSPPSPSVAARVYSAEAHEAFELWLNARNAESGSLLFNDAVPCLSEFVAAGWLVVGITNGRGDPDRIADLAPLFAFTVSGEDDGVFPHRKPAPQIFEVAFARAAEFLSNQTSTERRTNQRGQPADVHGISSSMIWWHVGDDRANDVGAAAAVGLHTVLLNRSLGGIGNGQLGGNGASSGITPTSSDANPYSTALPEEQAARAAAAASARPDLEVGTLDGLEAKLVAWESRRELHRGVGVQ